MDIVTLALAKKYADSINSGITNITTENNKLIFTLQNGNTIEVPLTDLVNNVVTEEELLNKLKDYIKNTDFASAEKAGIIKVDATSYATELDNGKLKASTKTYENYKDMNNESFVGKGTLENVIEGKNLETANNKVIFVDEDSTDAQYPSAKAMYKVSNKLDTLKDEVLDTGEASDSFIHIEDSAISELQELSIDGVCEQEATNLLDMSDFEMGGMWEGESNNTYLYRINNANKPIQVVPSSEYIIDVLDWGNFKGLRFGMHSCSEDGTFIHDSGWHQLKNNVPYHVTIRDDTKKIKFIFSGSTTSEIVETKSSENIDSYESAKNWLRGAKIEFKPIGGPSPNHPQEIKTITDNLSVTSCNKNLLPNYDFEVNNMYGLNVIAKNNKLSIKGLISKNNFSSITLYNDGSYVINQWWATKTAIKKQKGFFGNNKLNKILSLALKGTISNSKFRLILGYETYIDTIDYTIISNKEKLLDTKEKVNYICFGFSPETTIDIEISLQLEQGSKATSFEEHIQSQINANLPEGEFIGKIDDTYKDTLKVEYNEEDGQYHLMLDKKVGKKVFNGSENWNSYTLNDILIFRIDFSEIKDYYRKRVMSNYFTYADADTTGINGNGQISNKHNNFYNLEFSNSLCNNTAEFKTWLSTHNTEVYYVLATPYVVDLGVVDIPLSYNEITNIFTDSDLLLKINTTYYRNFKQTIKNINSDISSIKSNYVKNTDYATPQKTGVIRTGGGIVTTSYGAIEPAVQTYENYQTRGDTLFISKGTLENVITGKKLETANNKVTSLGTGSTDIEYPSAKCTYKIKEDLDNLKSDILEKGEVSDSCVHVEDSIKNELLKLEVDGVCEQKTTTGKNKFNYITSLVSSDYGLTSKINTDGSITTTGKITRDYASVVKGYIITDELEDGETYTLSQAIASDKIFVQINAKKKDDNTYTYILLNSKTDKSKSFRVDKTTYATYSIDVQTDTMARWGDSSFTITNKYMLCKGTDTADTSFEPYTGGIASPSPEYPQEINTITDSLSVTSCNDNIFNSFALENAEPRFIPRIESDGTIIIENVTAANGYCDTKTTLKQLCPSLKVGDTIYFYCITDFSENNVLKPNIYLTKSKYTIKNTYNTRIITQDDLDSNVVVYGGYNTTSHVKINISYRNVKSYQTHIQSQITANLPEGEFIGKLNDTNKDTLSVNLQDDGKYHLILNKMIGKVILDGSEGSISMPNQYKFNIDNVITDYLKGNNTYNNYSLSDRYIVVNQTSTNSEFDKASSNYNYAVNFGSGAVNNVRIKDVRFNSINDFKNELNANPIIFYYILAIDSRYTVDLGVVDMPLSYDEVTNIFTDSDLLPRINAKYYKNFITTIRNLQVNNETLKNELVSIKNRLITLENANTSVVSESEVADDIQEQ